MNNIFVLAKNCVGRMFVNSRVSSSSVKVASIGASGVIGQPLGILKKTPSIAHLALFDVVGTPGVAADLSYINMPAMLSVHLGPGQLVEALENANSVIVAAGVPRKPGMARDDLFNANAGIVRDIAEAAAKTRPKVFPVITTDPLNSTLHVASVVSKNNGCYGPKRQFGVTMLDIVRDQTFVSHLKLRLIPASKMVLIKRHYRSSAKTEEFDSKLNKAMQFYTMVTNTATLVLAAAFFVFGIFSSGAIWCGNAIFEYGDRLDVLEKDVKKMDKKMDDQYAEIKRQMDDQYAEIKRQISEIKGIIVNGNGKYRRPRQTGG